MTNDGSVGASNSATQNAGANDNKKKQTIVIAVTVSLGVLILTGLAYYAFRRARNNSKGSTNPSSPTSGLRAFRLAGGQNGGRDSTNPAMRSSYSPNRSPTWLSSGYHHHQQQQQHRPMSDTSSFTSGSDDSHPSSDGSISNGWRQAHASGRSSSIDFASVNIDDVRNSWWRYSDGFGRAISSPGTGQGTVSAGSHDSHGVSPTFSNANSNRAAIRHSGNRRLNIQRGPRGELGGISRPQMQENSLML